MTPYRFYWIIFRIGKEVIRQNRQIVGIPTGKNCALLVADLFYVPHMVCIFLYFKGMLECVVM